MIFNRFNETIIICKTKTGKRKILKEKHKI